MTGRLSIFYFNTSREEGTKFNSTTIYSDGYEWLQQYFQNTACSLKGSETQ